MKNNKVRLTEAQLHQVIKESVKKVLNEIALKGKSGKTYSLHGNRGTDWATMTNLRYLNPKQAENGYYLDPKHMAAWERDEQNYRNMTGKRSKAIKNTMPIAQDITDNMNESKRKNRIRESIDDTLMQSRLSGIIDQIDWYNGFSQEYKLSSQQIEHLKDLRDTVISFGESGLRWAKLADDMLKGNGYNDDMLSYYTNEFTSGQINFLLGLINY